MGVARDSRSRLALGLIGVIASLGVRLQLYLSLRLALGRGKSLRGASWRSSAMVVYVVYALARGEIIGSYPYHFIDVASFGYLKVFLNSLGLLVVYVVMGSVVYGIARVRTRMPGAVRMAS